MINNNLNKIPPSQRAAVAESSMPPQCDLHDWTLASVLFDWKEAKVTLTLDGPTQAAVTLIAEQVTLLSLSKRHEWGPSSSINSTVGPIPLADGSQKFEIEMQSGDTIVITAGAFRLPEPQ